MPQDQSEQRDGPELIAQWGDTRAETEFQLGTRNYPSHRHYRGQIFCIESGLMQVRTASGTWLLPPRRAGWIPPGEEHQVSISGAMSGWSVLLTPTASARLPSHPTVIGVTDIMRALVRQAVTWGTQQSLTPPQQRVMAVLLDELQQQPQTTLHIPMPQDRRLLRITSALTAAPGDGRSLAQWAAWAGLSARTMSRLFQSETGCSFGQWREQFQLAVALELLAQGKSVNAVSDTLGYATTSNFIAMFKRHFGMPPRRYFRSE
ncbi:helix-turn-helix domain-containing protein [Duganella sp. CY15W]|uniref:AraC family transcriptional regulator n=1 Tax=Duganella sp. CY15W TaxID=2692172 RepID=UPI00136D3B6D|nr:helix-turn-helix transcriptional regulator [Duganella sp. CY15W]MYM28300.1 helix-turn-helix domain-containing protein [Duganella sp. CY15W]